LFYNLKIFGYLCFALLTKVKEEVVSFKSRLKQQSRQSSYYCLNVIAQKIRATQQIEKY
jgi:hypothetical protein